MAMADIMTGSISGLLMADSGNFEREVIKSEIPVVVFFYSEDCPTCAALLPIFARMAVMYKGQVKFVRVWKQQQRQLAEAYEVKKTPTLLIFKDGKEVCSRLVGHFSNKELREIVEKATGSSCNRESRGKYFCDVLILGAGPAGLSAAIYTSRAKLYTIVVEEGLPGGQVSGTWQVANYPGTNGVIRGSDLMENMKRQALEFGTQLDDMQNVQEVDLSGELKTVITEANDYYAKAVIIATGAQPRKLPAEGEREYRGRGVHYCATCDGALYQDAEVIVVGGGNSAVEEAVFLTRYAKHVKIIHQFDEFQASKTVQDEALKNPDIEVVWNSEVRKINGDKFVKSVTVQNTKTGKYNEITAEGVFVYIGMVPESSLFKSSVTMSENGYIITDENMKTNIDGVFAAGDVRKKAVRQIASAAGDGVVAGIITERFINKKGDQ